MSKKAKSVKTLYDHHLITIEGVRSYVARGVITPTEFKEITGQDY